MPETKEKKPKAVKETPLMGQYNRIKAKYPDALLLFRVGDFYELFGEDAIKASEILGIVLTKRKNGAAAFIELAGFPHHSVDTYLPKLVRAGNRVAICDQLEDPKLTKKIVKRGVTELVTPGVSYHDQVLDNKTNNFLAAVHLGDDISGVSFLDVSTGEYMCAQGKDDYIDKLLQSFKPSEVLVQKQKLSEFQVRFGSDFYTYLLEDWVFTSDFSDDILNRHFGTKSLKGFGIERLAHGIIASGAALHYLGETKHNELAHISAISRIEEERYVWLDRFTIRNLELLHSPHPNAVTLIDVLDHTVSPMGSRMLKRWIVLPLKDLAPIQERLNIVEHFSQSTEGIEALQSEIKKIGDLERLISKVAVSRVNPKELLQLGRALDCLQEVKTHCNAEKSAHLKQLADQINPCETLKTQIQERLKEDPPALLNKGNVIADGVNSELDELRKIAFSGKDFLRQIQERESENTGIPSLKIAYNNVFGYYLEVRNTHKDKVPEEWIRKQTLVNAERYITEELKEYEAKILGAEEKISTLETRLFNELVAEASQFVAPIQVNAGVVSKLDCLLSFAKISIKNHYVKPELNEGFSVDIKEGRHPVIEQQLPLDEEYISNDIFLDNDSQQLMMITGPNMSGKSAILRQTALISLMAQMGSFVPAKEAKLGLVDKVFTRVGASDNISSGESTFMVEMNETASILNNLSNRSLILLDEIGRGTSTYDGISIAWAIAEFLHEHPQFRAKTLFATHYHELNDMSSLFPRIKNFNVAVKEVQDKIIFLRKLIVGGSNHSFGIHVAQLAGMPSEVVLRANELLVNLENKSGKKSTGSAPAAKANNTQKEEDLQLSFFQLDDPVLQQVKEEILQTDVNTLTPVEALLKLNEIKKIISGKS
ncbi:MAG: DNA mismatch repair protein MutS [Flavobacteriales bacterium]